MRILNSSLTNGYTRGSTTAARKTTTPERSSQMAKTKGRFTIISKGGGGGGGFKGGVKGAQPRVAVPRSHPIRLLDGTRDEGISVA